MGVFDPDRHDNILGITDITELNAQEALGIIRAEEAILDLSLDFVFNVKLVLDIHTTAFGHLYEWAGKWRTEGTNIGVDKEKVPYAMTEYCDQVDYVKEQHQKRRRFNSLPVLYPSPLYGHTSFQQWERKNRKAFNRYDCQNERLSEYQSLCKG